MANQIPSIVKMWRCANGHTNISIAGDDVDECIDHDCDSTRFTEMTDPGELMSQAANANTEVAHRIADAALLTRMKQLDAAFAARYERVLQDRNGFWYA